MAFYILLFMSIYLTLSLQRSNSSNLHASNMLLYTNLRSNVKGNLELLSAWLIDKGCCMPESRLVLQPTGNHYQTITTGTLDSSAKPVILQIESRNTPSSIKALPQPNRFYKQLAKSGTTTGELGELHKNSRSPGLEDQSKMPEHIAF